MIDAATATTYPDSLKINDLTIDGENRLLLNGSGSSVPFVIGNGLSLSNGAAFQTVESGLVIDNGLLKIINAQMSQDGGRVQLSDQGAFLDRKGTYNLTGGSFQSTVVGIGNVEGGLFNQYGGSAALSSLQIGYWFEGSAYHLYAGELQVSELLRIGGQYGGSLFIQDGGTNRALEVRIFPYYGGAAYYLNGGLLSDSNVLVVATGLPGSSSRTFVQNGGVHVITNALHLQGAARYLTTVPAYYYLTNGSLFARSLILDVGSFTQFDGRVSVADSLQLLGQENMFFSEFYLRGGVLSCANILHNDPGGDFWQTGGDLIVTNLFSFGGYKSQGFGLWSAHYYFEGGTLAAGNIELTGVWSITGSNQSNRVSNPGYFKLAGTLSLEDINLKFGTLTVASNASISFNGQKAILRFDQSSGSGWNRGVVLTITNWNGQVSGGGAEQLIFGASQSGLSSIELDQIRFANPAGSPAGQYKAQILDSGEVVPVGLRFQPSPEGDLVLQWSTNYTLQSSTNVAGPYEDIKDANPPYIPDKSGNPQRFFRLAQ